MKIRNVLAIGALSLVSFTSNAASLDFGINAPTAGSISYAGFTAPLVGSGIDVDTVTGLGTTFNADTAFACDSCVLEFTTGANIHGWDFGAGGTISIVGGVPAAGVAGGTTLLTGTFDAASVTDVGGGIFNFNILGASLFDNKDMDLLSFFGLPSVDYLGGMNISFTVTDPNAKPGSSFIGHGDAFTSAVMGSGDILNTPVPVPAAVWLFGSGLIGLIAIGRRKLV